MLIRGGENIYCIEVENVLYDHPAVMDAVLIGLAHRTLGEEPAAAVLHAGMLPRNANGKILKSELKALFGPVGGSL